MKKDLLCFYTFLSFFISQYTSIFPTVLLNRNNQDYYSQFTKVKAEIQRDTFPRTVVCQEVKLAPAANLVPKFYCMAFLDVHQDNPLVLIRGSTGEQLFYQLQDHIFPMRHSCKAMELEINVLDSLSLCLIPVLLGKNTNP